YRRMARVWWSLYVVRTARSSYTLASSMTASSLRLRARRMQVALSFRPMAAGLGSPPIEKSRRYRWKAEQPLHYATLELSEAQAGGMMATSSLDAFQAAVSGGSLPTEVPRRS